MAEQLPIGVRRLIALLNALGEQWEDDDRLWQATGLYPASEESARRMIKRDIAALRQLGFQIERTSGRRQPQYRLTGHVRFRAPVSRAKPRARRGGQNAVPITIDGIAYESMAAAARALGVTRQTISQRIAPHNPALNRRGNAVLSPADVVAIRAEHARRREAGESTAAIARALHAAYPYVTAEAIRSVCRKRTWIDE